MRSTRMIAAAAAPVPQLIPYIWLQGNGKYTLDKTVFGIV